MSRQAGGRNSQAQVLGLDTSAPAELLIGRLLGLHTWSRQLPCMQLEISHEHGSFSFAAHLCATWLVTRRPDRQVAVVPSGPGCAEATPSARRSSHLRVL